MLQDRHVSIVMLTHGQLDYTKQCLASVYEHTRDFELLIIDNLSPDDTPAYLREFEKTHENCRVIINEVNTGFAGGCNQGVREAKYDLICLLNNDTVAYAGWLDYLVDAMGPGVGAVGSRLLFPDGTLQHAGIHFIFRPDIDLPYFAAGHRFFRLPADTPEANIPEEVAGCTAACLLTTREVWDRVGGLDEGFVVANYEDVDFNLKVRDAGYKVLYEPRSTLTHFMNVTIKSKAGQADDPLQYHDQNLARLNRKWFMKLAGGLAWVDAAPV